MLHRLPLPSWLRFGNEVFTLTSFITGFFLLLHADSAGQNCTVNAGIPLQVCANAPMTLYGQASGLFQGSGNITWTQISGPAVVIVSPNSLTTAVSAYSPGNHYTFKLSALCSDNSIVWDTVTYYVKNITISDAGPDQQVCGGIGVLAANPPASGESGQWQIIGPANGIGIVTPSSPCSPIDVDPEYAGNSTLRWTITGLNGCVSSDELVLTNPGGITPVDAGPDQTLGYCYTNSTWTTMEASFGGSESGQAGTWTLVSGPNTPVIGNIHQNNTNIHGLIAGTYLFNWTVSGPCVNGTDLVSVTVPPAGQGVTEAITNNQSFCDGRTSFLLTGNNPLFNGETVLWTKVSGADPAVIANPASPVTEVTVPAGTGTYIFCYTITNQASGCYSFANATVAFNSNPTLTIGSGNSLILGCNDTTAVIYFSQTGSGPVMWSIVSGPPAPYYPVFPTPYYNAGISPAAITHLASPGTYVIRFRKSPGPGSGCATVFSDVTVTTSRAPSTSNAGTPQVLACNVTLTHLAGNNPLTGTGTWTQVSGPNTAVIGSPDSATTLVSGLINGQYFFRWIISGGPACGTSQSEVSVTVSSTQPVLCDAGSDRSVCYGTPVELDGNPPAPNETGTWTVLPSAGIIFSDCHDPHAVVTGLAAASVYQFTWTLVNACGSSSDFAIVTTGNTAGPVQSNAGPDQCQPSGTSTIFLAGNNPLPGTGLWTKISGGPSVILNPALFNTSVTGMNTGNYRFEWRISNGNCEPSRDTVVITISPPATIANAGSDQEVCDMSATLNGNVPLVGTGSWSQVAGNAGAMISDTNAPVTQVTGLIQGTYLFRWTIRNYACPGSFSDVAIHVSTPPDQPLAGPDQEVCGESSTVMAANAITGGTSFWSVVSGPNTPVFTNPASPTTAVTGLIAGNYILTWNSLGGPYCPPASDELMISVNPPANAGPDQYFCITEFAALTGNPGSSGVWTQVWGPDTAMITTTSDNTAIASGLVTGVFLFQFAVSAPGCATTTDVMAVIIAGQSDTADAGPDQFLCDADTAFLDGNMPIAGTGSWTQVSGPVPANISDPLSPSTIVTGLIAGTYIFQWTISNGTCSSSSLVMIAIDLPPAAANAGPPQTHCGPVFPATSITITMAGNEPAVGAGTWTIASGPPGAVITSASSPATTITGVTYGTYVFRWAITNGICEPSVSEVTVTVQSCFPVTINENEQVCAGFTAAGNVLVNGDYSPQGGSLSVSEVPLMLPQHGCFGVSAEGNYTYSPNQEYSGSDQAVVSVCDSAGNCTPDTIFINVLPTDKASAGANQSLCQQGVPVSTFMNANVPVAGTGFWQQVSGPSQATITNPLDPATEVYGLLAGEYGFMWTIANVSCPPSRDEMTVTVAAAPEAFAGPDLFSCTAYPVTITGSLASGYSALCWTTSGSGTFDDNHALHPRYIPGIGDIQDGGVVLTMTVLAGLPCPPVSDNLELIISMPSILNAGGDDGVCEGTPFVLSEASATGNLPVTWTTSGTGRFSDPHVIHPVYKPGAEDILNGLVILTVSADTVTDCGPDPDGMTLFISKAPTASAGPDGAMCSGIPFVVGGAAATDYSIIHWTHTGTGTLSGDATLTPVYTPAGGESGTVILTLSVSGTGECSSSDASDEMRISIHPVPAAEAGPALTIPFNSSVTLSGSAGGGSGSYTWDWQPAPLLLGNHLPGPVTVNLSHDILFELSVTDMLTGCSDSDSVLISVGYARIPPEAVNDYDSVDQDLPLQLRVMDNDKPGDLPVVSCGICSGPLHGVAVSNDDLTISYHAEKGFSGIDSLRYFICDSGEPCLCDTASVYIYKGQDIPAGVLVFYNVITPNGDGINDQWVIGGIEEFRDNLVEIYNRWGDLVNSFEMYNNTTRVWKGTNSRNEPLPDGTYFYLVSIKNVGTRTGWIFTRGGAQ